jgi:hypothetical protein
VSTCEDDDDGPETPKGTVTPYTRAEIDVMRAREGVYSFVTREARLIASFDMEVAMAEQLRLRLTEIERAVETAKGRADGPTWTSADEVAVERIRGIVQQTWREIAANPEWAANHPAQTIAAAIGAASGAGR